MLLLPSAHQPMPSGGFLKVKGQTKVPPLNKIQIYLEIGKQRVFAGAVDWPGWTRSGRDEESAIRALVEYGARYARAIESARLEFQPPADDSALTVIERLKGDTTTDFGSHGTPPKSDSKPMDADLLRRSEAVLKSCWRTFDRAVRAAGEKALRKGPRGGGRELDEIVRHILEADAAYLAKIGWPFQQDATADTAAELRRTRDAILEGLASAAGGKLPVRGPRGELRWTPRYFVRRVAWHALDHAWEIEDRAK
jgi:hypothetical protein